MKIAMHVTHEAVQKVGGIGTVIYGLITSNKYNEAFSNTLLYAPVFDNNRKMEERLGADSTVLYSGPDSFGSKAWRDRFAPVEDRFHIKIVYGKKTISDPLSRPKNRKVDIVIADIWDMKTEPVDLFKFRLWKHFGIRSDIFEGDRDYEQYVRIGCAATDIFRALYGEDAKAVVFAHEYMGMPSALSFEICKKEGLRNGDTTIFYAHEVVTARTIVENHPGHDLSFYNIMKEDKKNGISLEEEFGSFATYSRNEIVKRAQMLDYIFAVSDMTKEEYLYLCPEADEDRIKLVYNAVPISHIDYKKKKESTSLIKNYCKNLFSFEPDYIFTHVTRLVISKALWRDIRFLYHLDEQLHSRNKTGFFVMLSSLIATGRPNSDIYRMESEYGWPVSHREGWPDLVGTETDIYRYLELFNARSKAIKGILINQFGFDQKTCGARVPQDVSFLDLRIASDIEFGFSIYEPFGISQLETLPYGGIAAVSSVCGCAHMLKKHIGDHCYIIVDFTKIPAELWDMFGSKDDYKHITKESRDMIETEICREHAPRMMELLPENDDERKDRFNEIQKKFPLLDWDNAAKTIVNCLK